MDPALGAIATSILFEDPLGERRPIADPNGADSLELLCLRNELTSISSFEFALRERTARLGSFRHAYYARVRGVERLKGAQTLALVSERTPGVRLADVLRNVEQQNIRLDINTALALIRQLVPAVALLHENVRDVAHGAIGAERLVLTPNARLVIVEHVLGAALEQLRFSQERYWHDLRIPVPRSGTSPRFDHRTDVTQIGVLALELVLGRRLHDDEYPNRTGEVVASAWAISSTGGLEPLPPGLRSWLMRALQLDPRNSFASALDARAELDRMAGGDQSVAPAGLEVFVTEYTLACEPVDPLSSSTIPDADPEPQLPAEFPILEMGDSVGFEKLSSEILGPVPVPLSKPAAADVPLKRGYPLEGAELDAYRTQPKPRTPTQFTPRLIAIVVLTVVLLAGGAFGARRYFIDGARPAPTGTAAVNSNPTGAIVLVDGQPRGVTPVNLTLPVGSHVIELRGAGEPRSIPVTITAGSQVSHYIELPKEQVTLGQLQVRTEPTGARVTIDGLLRGPSPLMVADLTPGAHTVLLESPAGSVKQDVQIEAGATASLVVPLVAPQTAPVSGWITVRAPVDMQIFENGRLIGTSEAERIMVSAGKHDIELVNDTLAFRTLRSIQVTPGKVTEIGVQLPKQRLSVNAIPWAEVWIDGQRIGETPIGDLSVAVGPHEIVFRHPELGEQRHAISVTATAPARLSIDLRKK